jgi:AraC-like DNA-binding protein
MMSTMRHVAPADAEPDVRSFAATPARGAVVLPQPDGWDQLLHAASGVMTVATPEGSWVVPPGRALWVPAGVEHVVHLVGEVRLRSLYVAASVGAGIEGCRALRLTPLARELVLEAVRRAPLRLDDPRDEHLVRLLLDEVEVMPEAPLELPAPVDARAVALAELLGPTGRLDVEVGAACREVGVARRTAERLFRAETGQTLGAWRTRARMVAAIRLLAEGESATSVAVAVGYSTPSAFGAAFRRTLGTTPGRWFAGGV